MTREAFGPNLRRLRVQRGIPIEQIAETTNIAQDLLEVGALEPAVAVRVDRLPLVDRDVDVRAVETRV